MKYGDIWSKFIVVKVESGENKNKWSKWKMVTSGQNKKVDKTKSGQNVKCWQVVKIKSGQN